MPLHWIPSYQSFHKCHALVQCCRIWLRTLVSLEKSHCHNFCAIITGVNLRGTDNRHSFLMGRGKYVPKQKDCQTHNRSKARVECFCQSNCLKEVSTADENSASENRLQFQNPDQIAASNHESHFSLKISIKHLIGAYQHCPSKTIIQHWEFYPHQPESISQVN